MAELRPCPLWGGGNVVPTIGDFVEIENDQAGGLYRISGTAAAILANRRTDELAAKLTTWIVDQHRFGEPCPLITDDVLKAVEHRDRLSIPGQLDRFFHYLVSKGARADFTLAVTGVLQADQTRELTRLQAWLECRNEKERRSILQLLVDDGLILDSPKGFKLTAKGVRRYTEFQTKNTNSNQGFIAMWFDASMADASENGFEAAIRAAGYAPMRIDKKEHNNKIDDEIIAEIRRSRFVVADFTCALLGEGSPKQPISRGGVYFEAGFATGLGIPVIWCCRSDLIDYVHFDTRQFAHVLWENAEDLRTKLYNRICASIGSGANAPGL